MELAFIPLQGRFLRLEPLTPVLKEAVRLALDCDPATWAIMPVNAMGSAFEAFWSSACDAPRHQRMAFAIRRIADGRIIGTTSFLAANSADHSVEIGGSFLHPDTRGGAANPESKLLLLRHAFGGGVRRVQFNVDSRNLRSQAAMAKLGAVREGLLRKNRMTWTGYCRDTVIFSILDDEWPAVEKRLEGRLADIA